jgi:hypothetical protein
MTLVWLGYSIKDLRQIRGDSVGAENGKGWVSKGAGAALQSVTRFDRLPTAQQGIVRRFVSDLDRLFRSFDRVLRADGHVVLVVADSQVRGVAVPNSTVCADIAKKHGFDLLDQTLRPLPMRRRYLPPPDATLGTLAQRMKEEAVLTFARG